MTATERKYKGSLSLGKLEIALEAHEQLFGEVTKLEALGGFTIATYDDADFPAADSLALRPTVGNTPPPAPDGGEHLFDGKATVLGQELPTSVYRTS